MGSEMCIRDRLGIAHVRERAKTRKIGGVVVVEIVARPLRVGFFEEMALGSGNIDFRIGPLGQTRAVIAMEVRQQHALDSADDGGPQIPGILYTV